MKLTWRDFGLLGIIIYFTFIGGTFYSQLNFSLRLANQIIVTVILGLWLLAKLRRQEGLPQTYGVDVVFRSACFGLLSVGQLDPSRLVGKIGLGFLYGFGGGVFGGTGRVYRLVCGYLLVF